MGGCDEIMEYNDQTRNRGMIAAQNILFVAHTLVIAAKVASSWQHRAELHSYYCSDCGRGGELNAKI